MISESASYRSMHQIPVSWTALRMVEIRLKELGPKGYG
jgi:hypothetical protein